MNSGSEHHCPTCDRSFETRAQLVGHINNANTNCEFDDSDNSVDLSDPNYYLSRELSKLAFNRRVLQEAIDDENPILERVKFLAIFTKNMDEFFMKRVGGLKQQRAASVTERTPDGRQPAEHWQEVLTEAEPMLERQVQCYQNGLGDALEAAGIGIYSYEELSATDQNELDAYFEDSVLPTLTPLTIDSAKPFPHISNLSLSLGVLTKHASEDEATFSRIKMPKNRPRFVQIGEQTNYILLEELVRANLGRIFPNAELLEDATFRVTRNAEVRRNEEIAEDLLQRAEDVIEQRRFATVVRLEVESGMSEEMLEPLRENLDVGASEVFRLNGPLDFSDFMTLTEIDRPDLKLPEWTPKPHLRLGAGYEATGQSIFEEIQSDDILVHHPYHSFTHTVQRFLDEAATDPNVLAIKAAIYRTASDSKVIQRLIDAAENGKQVAVMVELKARFDEENNLEWAQRLEEEGIHVAYGTIGFKTHTKTALVVREEDDGVQLYSHIGTGNYHSETAKRYEDLGLFTANRSIGQDLVQLFNYFTGNSVHDEYRELFTAPTNMREDFVEAIQRETEHAKADKPAQITAKMNRVEDPQIIKELYRASQAGVDIDLIVRDICRLRPGLSGVSENITVVSIVNRFLEHSRIFRFHNAGDEQFYIGSADWMERNLDSRVEAVVPIHDSELQDRLRHILDLNLTDNTKAWELNSDGSYTQRQPGEDEPRNAQATLIEEMEDSERY